MEMTDENTDVTAVTVPAMINRNGTQKHGLRATTVVRVMKRLSKRKSGRLPTRFIKGATRKAG
ncbi:MAG: hypothetical protein ACLU99_14950 [Alphaproteobacteria bacterium]